jgi:hypothetical protein
VTPQVAAHSIIAVKGSDPVEQGTDGMVEKLLKNPREKVT